MLETCNAMVEEETCGKHLLGMQEAAETEAIAAWHRLQKQRRKLPELEAAAVVSSDSRPWTRSVYHTLARKLPALFVVLISLMMQCL